MDAAQQAECRRAGSLPRPHVPFLSEELSQAAGVDGRIPASGLAKTAEELPGELSVVGVFAEGELRGRAIAGPSAAQPVVDVGAGGRGWLGLDHEPESVAQCLAKNGTSELIRSIQRLARPLAHSACTPGPGPGSSRRSRDIPAPLGTLPGHYLPRPAERSPVAPPGQQPGSGSAGGTRADKRSGGMLLPCRRCR